MAEQQRVKSKVPRGVQYCCVCNAYRGKIIEGRRVSLHKFPTDPELNRVWMQRVRTVMTAGFKVTTNSKLCSEHFCGKCGPNPPHISLPSIFANKEFQITSIVKDQTQKLFNILYDQKPQVPGTSETDSTNKTELESTFTLMHDYCKIPDVQEESAGVDKSVQTDIIFRHKINTGVNADIQFRKDAATQTANENESVSTETTLPAFTFEDIKNCDKKVSFYTGFPSAKSFTVVFEDILKDQVGQRKRLRFIDEFFLVLMRIRLGLLLEDLADRFCISVSTCSTISTRWIHFLYINLSPLIHWPSRQQVDDMMPSKFRSLFPRCRIIIDCTELFTNRSASLITQSLSYSHYKSGMTWKGLIGITPNGILSFVSDLWLGSISDQQITNLSQLLDLLQPGDAIMADKGFEIAKYTTGKEIDLIIPPKRNKDRKMSASEIILTRRVARLRIHVERYMAAVKTFRILEQCLADTSQPNEIWKVCNALTMLYPPLNP